MSLMPSVHQATRSNRIDRNYTELNKTATDLGTLRIFLYYDLKQTTIKNVPPSVIMHTYLVSHDTLK